MARIQVSFEADIPDGIDREQVQEWVEFELGARGGLKINNPLSNTNLEAIGVSVWVY